MSIVIFSSISVPFSSENIVVRWYSIIFDWVSIQGSVNVQSLVNFSFHNSNRWLFNRKVCHFNVKTMEMNSFQRIADITCKFWLADLIKTGLVWNGAGLMEFSEKSIEINNRPSVGHKLMPVWALSHNLVISLEFCNDFFKIPRESKDITMLLLTESNVSSDIGIVLFNACLLFWFFLCGSNSSWEISNSLGCYELISHLSLQNSWQHFIY